MIQLGSQAWLKAERDEIVELAAGLQDYIARLQALPESSFRDEQLETSYALMASYRKSLQTLRRQPGDYTQRYQEKLPRVSVGKHDQGGTASRG